MTDPRRLSEVGADDFECDLILSARRDAPRPVALRRTLASIGVGVSLPLGVASVAEGAVVPVKVGALMLTKWLATGVALGVATAGGAKLTARALDPVQPAVVATTAARVAPPRAAAPERAVAEPRADALLPPEEAPSPPPVPQATAAFPVAPALGTAPSALLPEEVRAIDAARHALGQGDARGALALLRRYEEKFGAGALLPEARLLEVKALLAAGDRARAAAAGKRIIDANPRGPHAEAVRALLSSTSFP